MHIPRCPLFRLLVQKPHEVLLAQERQVVAAEQVTLLLFSDDGACVVEFAETGRIRNHLLVVWTLLLLLEGAKSKPTLTSKNAASIVGEARNRFLITRIFFSKQGGYEKKKKKKLVSLKKTRKTRKGK